VSTFFLQRRGKKKPSSDPVHARGCFGGQRATAFDYQPAAGATPRGRGARRARGRAAAARPHRSYLRPGTCAEMTAPTRTLQAKAYALARSGTTRPIDRWLNESPAGLCFTARARPKASLSASLLVGRAGGVSGDTCRRLFVCICSC
jgi:hypothetical protein